MRKIFEKELNRVIKELKKIKEIKAIYLFGSCAEGKALPFSDIDICAITDKKISERVRAEIASLSSKRIQVSIFDNLPIYIKFEVIKGKLLFARDREFLHKRIFYTLKEYHDFQPLLRRFEKFYGVRV